MESKALPPTEAKKGQWMTPIERVPDETREILENYSKIPPEEVLPHVRDIQARAFAQYPWPCIGLHTFLNLDLRQHPSYATALSLLHSGGTFLDAGCGLGQELRGLAYLGIPSSRLHGTDLQSKFLDFGHELFRDRETWAGESVAGDILDPGTDYAALVGRVDVLNAALFLHVFDLEGQRVAGRRLVEFLAPRGGAMILGGHLGVNEDPREVSSLTGRPVYWHTRDSLEEFWRGVGREVGVEWSRVDVEEVLMPEHYLRAKKWPVEGIRGLRFTVVRA